MNTSFIVRLVCTIQTSLFDFRVICNIIRGKERGIFMKSKRRIASVLISALILVSLTACTGLYNAGRSGKRSYSDSVDGIRVACVGDSITYGYGIDDWPENNYPAVLQELLGDGYIVNNYGVSGAAVHSGSNKPYASRAEYRDSLEFNPDIVIFMLGSNDSKPFNWKNDDEFVKDYLALIESYDGSTVIICTVAEAFFKGSRTEGETSFRIRPAVVDEIAEIIRKTAVERNLPIIDVNALTSDHPEWYIRDMVHLNAQGAGELAKAVYAKLKSIAE